MKASKWMFLVLAVLIAGTGTVSAEEGKAADPEIQLRIDRGQPDFFDNCFSLKPVGEVIERTGDH